MWWSQPLGVARPSSCSSLSMWLKHVTSCYIQIRIQTWPILVLGCWLWDEEWQWATQDWWIHLDHLGSFSKRCIAISPALNQDQDRFCPVCPDAWRSTTESHTDEPYFCPPAPEWWAFTDWEFTWYIEFCQERTPASSEEAARLNHCHINRFHTSNVVHFQISLSLSVSFSTLHLVHHAAIMLELPGLPSESEWVTVMIRNLPNNYGRNDVPCWRSRLYLVVWL